MSDAARAYVVRMNGRLLVNTCHEHRRGSAVNWLWLTGIRVLNDWTDDVIMEVFHLAAGPARAEIVEVELVPVEKTVDNS